LAWEEGKSNAKGRVQRGEALRWRAVRREKGNGPRRDPSASVGVTEAGKSMRKAERKDAMRDPSAPVGVTEAEGGWGESNAKGRVRNREPGPKGSYEGTGRDRKAERKDARRDPE